MVDDGGSKQDKHLRRNIGERDIRLHRSALQKIRPYDRHPIRNAVAFGVVRCAFDGDRV